MMTRFSIAVMAALLFVSTQTRGAGDFEYGKRPTGAILDATGLLEPRILKEISDPLVRISRDEGIDVIVVVLSDIGAAPPEHVARRFAAEWCDSPLHAVVLHVPGHADSPWIVPAGELMDVIRPEIVSDAVAKARRNASREPGEHARIRAAATEAADMLRYWMGNAVRRGEVIETERTKIRLELETKSRRQRVFMLLAAASAIPLIVGFALVLHLLRKAGPRRFPKPDVTRRLCAPHAGGNHALVELGPAPFTEKP
ncbi:MAG: hypothetical protein Q8Q59_06150 [Luteolibacter sp.]|jgi:hypothetical protein|nr:hypothetical protein [Luteolibacter sp.]